jgi:hypothetical protein
LIYIVVPDSPTTTESPSGNDEALVSEAPQGQIVVIGKPAKFTKKTLDILFKALQAGTPLKYALAAANIPDGTYKDWLKKEAAGNNRFSGFSRQVEECRNKGIFNVFIEYRKRAQSDPRCLERIMEWGDPETFAPKAAINSKIAHSGNVKIIFEDFEDKKPEKDARTQSK